MQARCRFDSFSGSVMQLHKDELLLFIDELHTSLEDYYLESGSICLVCEIRNSRENGLGVVEFDLSSITAKISFIQLLFREFHRTFGLQFLNDYWIFE